MWSKSSFVMGCNFIFHEDDDSAMAATGGEPGTHISLESLFRRAGQQHSQGASNVIPGPPPGGTQPPPLLR